jgi:hypothetical protein
MREVEANWSDLMCEIFSYQGLVRKKLEELKEISEEKVKEDPHISAIQRFDESISGLCDLLNPVGVAQGFIGRTYTFLRNFCCSYENEKKLKDYTSSISRAAALLSFSTTIQIQDQVFRVESKVDMLINEQKTLLSNLDAALAGYREKKDLDKFAQSISSLLGQDIKSIKEELSTNQDELKSLFREGMAEVSAKLDMIINKSDIPAVPAHIKIADPAASAFWCSNFSNATSVPVGLIREVGPCKKCRM